MRRVAVLMASMVVYGCTDAGEPAPGMDSRAIIGGIEDRGDPAVVMLQTPDGLCTGTLVAPRVVLTAAHCIARTSRSGTIAGMVSFGARTGEFTATRSIVDMIAHRRYTSGLYGGFDIGLVRLSEPAPPGIEPMPMNIEPLDDSMLGATVRAIGFGVSNGALQTGAGVKRTVFLAISGLSDEHIVVGSATMNTCQGDSGGPILMPMDGVETIIGVTSFGAAGCTAPSNKTRVDVYVAELVREVIAAWDGPCQADGVCVAEGCGDFADPDCEPCSLQGICAEGCARLDLDCPVAGLAGDPCTNNDGCEGRLCTGASDDPRVRYCSLACQDAGDCLPPITVCGASGTCEFAGPTPSTQGAACESGADCRSGMCDARDDICVEPCGDGDACGDGYACADMGRGVRVCRLAEDGGCRAAPGLPTAGGVLVLGLVMLALGRRRV